MPTLPADQPAPTAAPHEAPTWRDVPRPPVRLGGAVVALAVLWALVAALRVVLAFPLASRYARAIDWGDDRAVRLFMSTRALYERVDLAHSAVMCLAFLAAGLWLWRTHAYLSGVSLSRGFRQSRGWVWAGWVLPGVAFWYPYQIVADICWLSGLRRLSWPRVPWWWACWIVARTAGAFASEALASSGGLTPAAVPVLECVAAAATVGGASLWVSVVVDVRRSQQRALCVARPVPWTRGRRVEVPVRRERTRRPATA